MKEVTKIINFLINKNIGRHAQALSFATVLCIVPISTLFFGFLINSTWFNLAESKIEVFLIENLFPKQLSQTFLSYIKTFSEHASSIQKIGLFFFILSIIFLFLDMSNSFSDIASSSQERKIKKKFSIVLLLFLVPLFMLFLLGIIFWIANLQFVIVQSIVSFILLYHYILMFFVFLLLWFWFYFLFFALSNVKFNQKILLIGSFLGALIFIFTQKIFSFYLTYSSSYEIIYGVFSIIPVFLIWTYLNWQIILYNLALITYFDNKFKMGKTLDQAS